MREAYSGVGHTLRPSYRVNESLVAAWVVAIVMATPTKGAGPPRFTGCNVARSMLGSRKSNSKEGEVGPVTDKTSTDKTSEATDPGRVRTPDKERRDGRPTGDGTDEPRSSTPQEQAPTIAPEEQGHSPSTEHAPGADL
jgi:hypothetical protein